MNDKNINHRARLHLQAAYCILKHDRRPLAALRHLWRASQLGIKAAALDALCRERLPMYAVKIIFKIFKLQGV